MQQLNISSFATSDPDRARAEVARLYPGSRLRLAEGGSHLSFEVQSVTAGALRLDQARLALEGRAHAQPPQDFLLCLVPTDGVLEAEVRGATARFGPGHPALCPPGVAMEVGWTSHFAELVVPMSPAAVSQHAASVTGVREKDFRFEGMRPVNPAMRRLWVATVGYLFRQLRAPDSPMAHPLVQAEAVNLLTGSLLAAFPNTTMSSAERDEVVHIPPSAVRRAMAFIEAHAGEPLTVAEIAEAAGIGVRGLQASFARHAGTTPLGFARRIRLERAHRDLATSDPSRTTVRQVAARWGFAKPERFAAAYRERFGELPSRTLRG